MKPTVLLAAAMTVVGIGWMAGTAAAGSTEHKAFRGEVQTAREQAKAERESTRTALRQLKDQMHTLRAQAKETKEPEVRAQLKTDINALREQMRKLMEEKAAQHVAWAEQQATFAQRRVELAKEHLAKVQARETNMDERL